MWGQPPRLSSSEGRVELRSILSAPNHFKRKSAIRVSRMALQFDLCFFYSAPCLIRIE